MAATIGCFRAVKYQMGDKSYLSRTEAESAQRKVLEERLSTCQLANHQVGEKCILVFPTRRWIQENYIISKGLGSKADMLDYIITTLQRKIETDYALIIKSNLFDDCKITHATVGNGEGEYLAPEDAFEFRSERGDESGQHNLP